MQLSLKFKAALGERHILMDRMSNCFLALNRNIFFSFFFFFTSNLPCS